jgi:hypothetical protein
MDFLWIFKLGICGVLYKLVGWPKMKTNSVYICHEVNPYLLKIYSIPITNTILNP